MITSDNFRKFRRDIQGRGVNLRQVLVAAGAFDGTNTPVSISALKAQDEIISVLDLSSSTDISNNIVRAVKASLAVEAGANKGLDYTARKAGADGNNIYVEYLDPGVASASLAVSVVYRVISGGKKHVISVSLATNSGSVITTTAAQLREAVLEQEDAPGHPLAADLVDVALHAGNDGTGVLTATVAAALAGGANDSQADGTAASRDIFAVNQGITWSARKPGVAGNNIGVSYLDPAAASQALSITVNETGDGKIHVKVHLATDVGSAITTTALLLKQAVEDSEGVPGGPFGAADFVKAVLDGTGADVLAAQSELFLQNGSDSGSFKISGDVGSDNLIVMWLTRKGF